MEVDMFEMDRLFRLAPDGAGDGAGGGGGTGNDTGASGDIGQTSGQATFTPEQQAHIDHVVGEARKKAREQAKAELEAAAKKAAEDVEAAKLEQNKEFQALAEKHKTAAEAATAEAAALKPQVETLTADRDRYKAALETYVAKAREGLPGHITVLLDKMDPVEQLTYLTTNGDKLRGQVGGGSPGNNPARGNRRDLSDDERRAMAWRPTGL
jgi:uncharacterized protein YicC (UPF0701 family)